MFGGGGCGEGGAGAVGGVGWVVEFGGGAGFPQPTSLPLPLLPPPQLHLTPTLPHTPIPHRIQIRQPLHTLQTPRPITFYPLNRTPQTLTIQRFLTFFPLHPKLYLRRRFFFPPVSVINLCEFLVCFVKKWLVGGIPEALILRCFDYFDCWCGDGEVVFEGVEVEVGVGGWFAV